MNRSGRTRRSRDNGDSPLARLTQSSSGRQSGLASSRKVRGRAVKKLLLVALVGLGIVAAWRKMQADRAELDLWTEATTNDD